MGAPTRAELENRFTHHPPNDEQVGRYETLRSSALNFAQIIVDTTPYSRDQSLALTSLEDCVMRANRAIACNEVDVT